MAETTTVTSNTRVHQDGNTVLDAWVGNTTTLNSALPGTSPNGIGVIFDWSDLLPLWIVEPTQITFRVTGGAPAVTNVTSSVYIVDESAPADYSTALLPGTRGVLPERLVCQATGDYRTGNLDWNPGADFTFELGRRYTGGAWQDDATLNANWRRFLGRRVRHSSWSGRIAFSFLASAINGIPDFYLASENADAAGRPRVTYLQWSTHTGHDVGGVGGRAHATFCSRSGVPLRSDELIEDGYIPGLYVHPAEYEPEDRTGEDIEIPDTERERDERTGTPH